MENWENESVPETPEAPAAAETVPEQPAEAAAPEAVKQKKSFWQRRKEKNKARKQLRKDLRRQKREAFAAKTLLGKTATLLGKLIQLICVLALVVTVLRVNYVELGTVMFKMLFAFDDAMSSSLTVTQEEIQEIAPLDEERGAAIDASAPIADGETWAIYVYMVGSDLESATTKQMSDVAKMVIAKEAEPLAKERQERNRADMYALVDNVLENGMDLPNAMYEKQLDSISIDVSNSLEQVIGQIRGNMGDYHAASVDISEIMAVTLPENVQMVIQPGGAGSWTHNMINPNRTQRFLYDSDGMHKVYEGHISNMGNPQTLVDFLAYCETEYPADHTMVVFWNHGGGAFGYGWDTLYLDDNLTLEEMRWAFEQVYTPDEEEPPVDIIGFDACLMASMEVAHTFHGLGSYLVGSEETEPGNGWDYTDWLTRVAENPRMNPLQMSRAVADSYMDYYAGKAAAGSGSSAEVFSVLDLGYADDLYEAYSDFAGAALQESTWYAGTAAYIGKSANSSIKFAGSYQDVYNTVDMGLFMEGINQLLEEEAQAVLDVLDDMVLYNRTGNGYKEATGLTVYYPASVRDLNGLNFAVRYVSQICEDPDIQALYYYKVAGCLTEEMQAYLAEQGYGELLPMDAEPLKQLQKTDVTVAEDGSMFLPITAEAYILTQDHWFNLMQVQEDGSVLRLGYDSYVYVDENGQLRSEYDGTWAQIDGVLLPVEIVSYTETSLRYRARVKHNGADSNLLLLCDLENYEWEILGVQSTLNTTETDVLADRYSDELLPGDVLVPIYEQYDIHTGVGEEYEGESITYREDTVVEEGTLPDGTYMSYISLVDARGDVYDMQVATFQMNNGTIGNAEIMKMP